MNKLSYSPWDLLPINNPKDEQPNKDYFYNNVIKYLIPDIVEMEANGVPISLDKVDELDKEVSRVLEEVKEKLKNNPLMIKFLESKYSKTKKEKVKELEQKKKTPDDFLPITYNFKNVVHRTYIINQYLDDISKSDMKMNEWSIKDIKKLNQIIASKFISDLLEGKEFGDNCCIIDAICKLAEDKCKAYNKNRVNEKIETIYKEKSLPIFNPSSPTQLREFFDFYKIESENTTPTGNLKWDRKELERIQKVIEREIEKKENNNE